ncbi:hypothetical protein Trydic_g9853 [Trypoxylus dichotomus]
MHRADTSKAMVRLVYSYLRLKAFMVKLEEQRSTAGVPQGSAISPILFSIYTSDIPAIAHVNLAMYLDDVCVFDDNRPLPPNSPRHFASQVYTAENCRLSREKHGRALLKKQSPKKKAWQPSRIYLPKRYHRLTISD